MAILGSRFREFQRSGLADIMALFLAVSIPPFHVHRTPILSHSVRLSPGPAVDAEIRPPGSKSLTNRALVCAALAHGTSRLTGVLDSEDTQVMVKAWQQLGLDLRHDVSASTLEVVGCGGDLPITEADIYVANSGTTIRFLTAALSVCSGVFRLDGVPRMRERPIGDLLTTLRDLGCDVTSENAGNSDCPPVKINAAGLEGGHASIAGNISSQFLSAVMLASPLARNEVRLAVSGELVSVPYVAMTAAVMHAFGAQVHGDIESEIHVSGKHPYVAADYAIEPDASAASYFWGAAAITGGRARVLGLNQRALQGDVQFCEVLEQMGCRVQYADDYIEVLGTGTLRGVDVNMANVSDTVQTLAAVALFAKGPTTVRGVAHNRVKETDRIGDLARELRKLGAVVEEMEDGMRIEPPANVQTAEIETYHDHRMAMSLALVGLRAAGISILDPDCTAKTYPNYWEDLVSFSGCRIDGRD